jgi:hypothetical protein
MDDESIDSAINDVAREMTEGELHPSFRAQVLRRIEPFEVRRSWFVVRALAGIAAIAAVVVVSLFQVRQSRPVARPSIAAPAVASDRPASGAPQIAASARTGDRSPRIARSERSEGRSELHASRTPRPIAIAPSDVDALAPPPLDVESIAVAALPAPASIQLNQLQSVPSIAVAPLSTDDQGEKR